jgi:hypothetical protein
VGVIAASIALTPPRAARIASASGSNTKGPSHFTWAGRVAGSTAQLSNRPLMLGANTRVHGLPTNAAKAMSPAEEESYFMRRQGFMIAGIACVLCFGWWLIRGGQAAWWEYLLLTVLVAMPVGNRMNRAPCFWQPGGPLVWRGHIVPDGVVRRLAELELQKRQTPTDHVQGPNGDSRPIS